MIENEISRHVVLSEIDIHKNLGPGLFESVYEEILAAELISIGFDVQRQVPIPLVWKIIN